MSNEKRLMFSGILNDMRDDPRHEWDFLSLPPSMTHNKETNFSALRKLIGKIINAICQK